MPQPDELEYLENCDIKWVDVIDGDSVGFRGTLISESCEVPSQKDSNVILIVYDDLRLWENELWINDKVYVKSTGKQVIGNKDGIPYILNRAVKNNLKKS
jgi:hypothetical protein